MHSNSNNYESIYEINLFYFLFIYDGVNHREIILFLRFSNLRFFIFYRIESRHSVRIAFLNNFMRNFKDLNLIIYRVLFENRRLNETN